MDGCAVVCRIVRSGREIKKNRPRVLYSRRDIMKGDAVSRTEVSCRRCGTCCRKGGPGLYREDTGLIREGVLFCEDIICFREGEFAYDQARGCLAPLKGELLKIRGKAGTWECMFYDASSRGCGIYTHRPLECRTLMCWDTAHVKEIMRTGTRLQRRDLVPEGSGLAALIADHDGACALALVARRVLEHGQGDPNARPAIIKMCSYDRSFREALQEKTGISDHAMECYFGRPLFEAVRGYDPWFASEDFLKYFVV